MNDITQVFGKEKLHCWRYSSLDEANIPAAAKEFLANIGLPDEASDMFLFGPFESLEVHPEKDGWYVIGRSDDVLICLDAFSEGKIMAVEQEQRVRLVNSGIEQFGSCLALYESYRREVRVVDEDEANDLIDKIESEMQSVDPVVFDDKESWWSVVVEQMRAGML